MKTFRFGRIFIWIISAAIAGFSAACIFWTPYDQSRLFRPIPAGAVLVSSHHDLGPRLGNLATNIFFKPFFESDGTDFKNLQKDRYVSRILASRSVFAYVPGFSNFTLNGELSSSPALVISSWVGGWSAVMRWALWIHPPGEVKPLGNYNGHRVWAYKKPVTCFGAVNYLSFVIDEGIFIGCLSRERDGVVYLLKNYDARKDSILNVPQFRLDGEKDRVWLRFDLPNAAPRKTFFAAVSLDELKNDYLAATIRFEPEICHDFDNDVLPRDATSTEIGKINACAPAIVASLPASMAFEGIREVMSPAWTAAIGPLLSSPPATNNICLLTVFTGVYGGQFGKEPFRLAVPTVLLAVSGCRPEPAKAEIFELLDLINLKYRLGLIMNSVLPPAGRYPVFTVESTSGALLGSLPIEDQPAFAFYNDWLLLASNGAGLRKVLIDFQFRESPANNAGNIRRKKAFIRIDPGEGGKALRFALTASIMMLDADARNPSKQGTIKIIKAARSWLENIDKLKNCAAWMESENGRTVVRLEIGSRN